MNQLLQKLIPYLISSSIDYRIRNSTIEVALPGGFGHLEIRNAGNQDVVIGILNGNRQITGENLGLEESPMEDRVFSYIQGIYSGKLLMVEEQQPDGAARKKIVDNLDQYLRDLPNRTTFRIHKKTLQTKPKDSFFSDL
jgi:hypothetical protein